MLGWLPILVVTTDTEGVNVAVAVDEIQLLTCCSRAHGALTASRQEHRHQDDDHCQLPPISSHRRQPLSLPKASVLDGFRKVAASDRGAVSRQSHIVVLH